MLSMAKSNKELDRLAWKQRIEEAERLRKRIRRREWWLDRVETVLTIMIVLAAVLILISSMFLIKGE